MLETNRKFKLTLLFAFIANIALFTEHISENGWITAMTIILGGYALSNVTQKGVTK